MGRKPDPLVVEFFERGAKLQDASNRYHHTCKACGQQFAKGRVESLHLHIRQKCPSIGAEERARIHELLGGCSEKTEEGTVGSRSRSADAEDKAGAHNHTTGIAGRTSMTALDALAEVSRQRLDGQSRHDERSEERSSRKRKRSDQGSGRAPTVDPIDPFLRQQMEILLPDHAGEQHTWPGNSVDASLASTTHDGGLRPSQPSSGGLSLTWIQEAPPRPHAGTMMKLFHGMSSIEATLASNTRRPPAAPLQNQPEPHHHQFSIHDDEEEPTALKPRQKFTPDRRREVRSVRLRGACMRCKVLKKPCSESTPCSTCLSIEDARIWKTPCTRGKIADVFELYTCGLHKLIADREINRVRAENDFEPSTMLVEGTYFRGEPVPPFRFPSLQASSTTSSTPSSAQTPDQSTVYNERFHIIDPDIESIFKSSGVYIQLHDYVRHSWRSLITRRTTDFLQPTLSLAVELAEKWPASLMTGALDLWALTEMCVNPLLIGQILLVAPEAPSPDTTISSSASGSADAVLSFTLSSESNRLIPLQMRQYFDKLCAHYWKTLIGDLEQRLVQKQALNTVDEKTEINLVTVLVLNCVEKMCWQFSLWITAEEPQSPGASDAEVSRTSRTDKWALPTPPQELVAKGAVITEVLTMLLRTRNVLPRVMVDEDDVLRHESRNAKSSPSDATNNNSDLATDDVIARWLDALTLKAWDIGVARAKATADLEGKVEVDIEEMSNCNAWQMRFVGRLLLACLER